MKHSRECYWIYGTSMNSTTNLFVALVERPVGVPLDGGLLTVLGAEGVANYITREK